MEEKQTAEQVTEKNLTPHRNSIDAMGVAIIILGFIGGLVLGNIYQIATIKEHKYLDVIDYTYSFNWGLCITVIIAAIVFALLFFCTWTYCRSNRGEKIKKDRPTYGNKSDGKTARIQENRTAV